MSAQIIDGKAIAKRELDELTGEIARLKDKGVTPSLSVILVGDDPASMIYVASKERTANSLGMTGACYRLPGSTTEQELIELIDKLNADDTVHGILVQLPLPEHIDSTHVLCRIRPDKDVDGLHPHNSGLMLANLGGVTPCTPRGVITLIRSTGEEIDGKRAVVVGRSRIVGRPTSMLLMNANATVSVCHTHTHNLAELTREADILVSATGHMGLIRGDMIKPGAIVIDVGIHRVEKKLYGDVVFDEAVERAAYITPVPGGVGPMTIAMLMKNTVDASRAWVR